MWRLCRRRFSTVAPERPAVVKGIDPNEYRLKCGLEIHAQLSTPRKLFSMSKTGFHEPPNTLVAFFDAALPGTQPILNPHCILYALRAAASLNCKVHPQSSFDRKHYFYGDQPAGYQITQKYHPIASNGVLNLYEHDGLPPGQHRAVHIEQLQLEQDTGKSVYKNGVGAIDLNRSGSALVEIVTAPDVCAPLEARHFIRKLQTLLRHIGVCSGDMETGAMRVDVNVSVNGGCRVEIKNLSNTSAVVNAIRAEYERQVAALRRGEPVASETRGWDGKTTRRLRGKEETVDYRYMPDPELDWVDLADGVAEAVRGALPELPDEILRRLLAAPRRLSLKDARTIVADPELTEYYFHVHDYVVSELEKRGAAVNFRAPSNWVVHELLGALTKAEKKFSPETMPWKLLGDLIVAVQTGEIRNASAKLLLGHLVNSPADHSKSVKQLVEMFELEAVSAAGADGAAEELREVCRGVMAEHSQVVADIRSGERPGGVKFLLGMVMRETQGRMNPKEVMEVLQDLLKA